MSIACAALEPEWQSQHLCKLMSTMDLLASRSLTQITNSAPYELEQAFQSLQKVIPKDEFEAAMTQYATAALRLLEDLQPPPQLPNRNFSITSQDVSVNSLNFTGDQSRVNLLQTLSDYTDSRVNIASFGAFSATPYSMESVLLHKSASSETTSLFLKSPLANRVSMASKHLHTSMSIDTAYSELHRTPNTARMAFLKNPSNIYEDINILACPTPSEYSFKPPPAFARGSIITIRPADVDSGKGDDISATHNQNTMICKAIAEITVSEMDLDTGNTASRRPTVRPLGCSTSFKMPRRATRTLMSRRASQDNAPPYIPYQKIREAAPDRTPESQDYTKLPSSLYASECTTTLVGKTDSLLDRTLHLISRTRFGSKKKKKQDTQCNDKSKSL